MRQWSWVLVGLLVWLSLNGTPAPAQGQGAACVGSSDLGCIIPNLYGPNGLVLPSNFHAAHFQSGFQSNFQPFNGAVATELARLPIVSPAAGFTYVVDSATGVFTRSAQSFGPVLTERAETIGRGKVYLGFAYQRFSFDSIDGIDLDNIPVVFQHVRETGAPFEDDFIVTRNSIDMTLNQFTLFGTLGLTNRLSVSIALPILDLDMKVASDSEIHRIGPANPTFGEAHFFDSANPASSTAKTFTSSGSAKGIGDLIFRFKGTLLRGEKSSLALATDVIAPSGDERNFLGAGTWGVRPFLAYSINMGRVTPHFNVGYQINGSSLLAGNISNDTKGHLPNQFTYAFGADVGVNNQLTLALDFLGQRVSGASKAESATFTSPRPERDNPSAGIRTYGTTRFTKESINLTSASVGGKWNPVRQLLVTGNLLFRLNDSGLKANVVPLVGFSYSF